jgi:hypothetical protein
MPVSSAGGTGNCTLAPMRRDPSGSERVARTIRAAALPSSVLLSPTRRLIRASEARRPATGLFMPPSRPSKRLSGPLLPASEALNRVSRPLLPGSEALNRASERLLPASEPWKGAAGFVKPVRKRVGRGTRHKVMQSTVPVGSVRNRALSSPDQRPRRRPAGCAPPRARRGSGRGGRPW